VVINKGNEMRLSVKSIDLVLNVIGALHCSSMNSEAWKTIKEELDRFGMDYADILKSRGIMESLRDDVIVKGGDVVI
jgi:hypothetical protein